MGAGGASGGLARQAGITALEVANQSADLFHAGVHHWRRIWAHPTRQKPRAARQQDGAPGDHEWEANQARESDAEHSDIDEDPSDVARQFVYA